MEPVILSDAELELLVCQEVKAAIAKIEPSTVDRAFNANLSINKARSDFERRCLIEIAIADSSAKSAYWEYQLVSEQLRILQEGVK